MAMVGIDNNNGLFGLAANSWTDTMNKI